MVRGPGEWRDSCQFQGVVPDTTRTGSQNTGKFRNVTDPACCRHLLDVGASNYTAERLREALTISRDKSPARYEIVQPGYSLYDRNAFEQSLAPVIEEEGLAAVGFFSLASG